MERFLAIFGAARIAALRADREFVGEDGLRWLHKPRSPCPQRIKRDPLVPNGWNRMMRIDVLFGALKPAEAGRLPGRRPVGGCVVHRWVLRLDDGELLALASDGAPQAQAIDAYAGRWQSETRFGCLKTRGFHFEDTPLKHAARLAKRRGLLALAFAWTHQTGERLHDGDRPIPLKNTLQRPLTSLVRHGLDFLRNIALNLAEKFQDFLWALKILSCT